MKHLLLLLLSVLFLSPLSAQTGIPVSEMSACDGMVSNLLTQYGIPGATFAMARNGKLVYMRGFGNAVANGNVPVHPHNIFRIASVSKPITGIAIMKLVQDGRLSLSAKVFGPGGLLASHPYLGSVTYADNRINNITVQHLLEHSSGWNRDIDCAPNPTTPYTVNFNSCDPIGFPLHVTHTLGEANPVTGEMHIKFLMQKGLNFAPGAQYAYSNIGYLVLGEVIEAITGKTYEQYVKEDILAPINVCDMHIGKSLYADKMEREVDYVGNGFTIPSAWGTGQNVPWEYGGWNLEAMDAHGGWIATARDLVRLITAVDGFNTRPDFLTGPTINTMVAGSATNANYAKGWQVNSAGNWWHTGSLDGTASFVARSSNGAVWALILNKRLINSNSTAFWNAIDALPWNCIAQSTGIPAHDFFDVPEVAPSNLSISRVNSSTLNVSWTPGDGDGRVLVVKEGEPIYRFPLDGTEYNAGATLTTGDHLGFEHYVAYRGTGNSAVVSGLDSTKTYYFRLIEYNKNTVTGNNALYQLCKSAVGSAKTSVVSSVDPLQALGIRFFPNPTQDMVSVESAVYQGAATIRVLDATGREVMVENKPFWYGEAWSVSLGAQPDGLYMIYLQPEGQAPVALRVLKAGK